MLVEPPRKLKQQVETGLRFCQNRQDPHAAIDNCRNLHQYPSFTADVFTVSPAEVRWLRVVSSIAEEKHRSLAFENIRLVL